MPHQLHQEPLSGEGEVDLYAPFTSDTILEVRTGKMKLMPGLTVKSGIDKSMHNEPVRVTELGLEGDEHDPTFHGGIDKAIHGYCSTHYASWRAEYPSAASAFQPGGFGENLVTRHLNERNLCIGDIVSITRPNPTTTSPDTSPTTNSEPEPPETPVLLQASLPRQPCFKLNHRFQLKNFAPQTWRLSRTGWYFRVLQPGHIRAGDTIALVSRPHPRWTIERVQEFLHRDTGDAEANAELAGVGELGAESRDVFWGRVVRLTAREAREARGGVREKWRGFRVVERTRETGRVVGLVLEAGVPLREEEGDEVALKPGAHVKVRLGNGLVRAYSVVGGDRNRFQLGVALDEKSRGGSRYLHEVAVVGHEVEVGAFTGAVPFASAASHHVFVAGGVGITAFLALIESYASINLSVKLHYAVRSADEVPFRERLAKLGDRVVIYDKAAGQRLDIRRIVEDLPWNSQLYFCGPRRFMDEAAKETKARGIAEGEVHFEAFEADVSGDPFEAVVANKGGKTIKVGEDETLLECLQKEFGDVDSSCCVGNCGTCRVSLKGGRVDHRGTALTEEEKATSMLACVSRGIGSITIEI
ncbi:pyruvate kinase-like protein [Chaetomium sp. MPI-CAGE-AT-0009]|nr:pyruvate kinase-like protein [Chaetomium sp. MPI-CAGE-AT-0009]